MTEHAHNAISSSSNSNRSQQIGLVMMILLAVGGLMFRWEPGNQAIKAETVSARSTPDTIVSQPELDIFDENGRRIRQLQGLQLQHFETGDRSIISEAHAQFHKKALTLTEDNLWQLKGNQATVSDNNSVIELHGNVLLWNQGAETGKTEFSTEQLQVNMSDEIAETDKPVKINHLSSVAEAVGMRANLTNENVTLLSHVKEVHEFRH